MIKVSKLTDYAVVVLAEMAKADGKLLTASGLSEKTALPEPTVAKLLKLLAKGNVVVSTRGASGGYQLILTPDHISIASIIVALEGPVELTACVEGGSECCSHSQNCQMKGKWDPINHAMKTALENVTLAQMIGLRE